MSEKDAREQHQHLRATNNHDSSDSSSTQAISEETRYFHNVVRAYRQYRAVTARWWERKWKEWMRIDTRQRQIIGAMYEEKLERVRVAFQANADFLDWIVPPETSPCGSESLRSHVDGNDDVEQRTTVKHVDVSDADMDKVRSTLRQFVRDWSEEASFTFINSFF